MGYSKRFALRPSLTAALATGVLGCGALLGYDDFTGPDAPDGGTSVGGSGGHAGSSSTGGGGSGGAGGEGAKYHCFLQGEASTFISDADVQGVHWTANGFYVLPRKDPSGGVHVVVYDDAGQKLYLRSGDDPDKPNTLVSYDGAMDGVFSGYTQADVTGSALTLFAGSATGVGKLTATVQSGSVVGAPVFTPFSSDCGGGHGTRIGVAAGSWAYTCGDGAPTNETFSLYLDGQLLESGMDEQKLGVIGHHLIGGQHVIFTGPDLGQAYWRLGAAASELKTAHAVSMTTRPDHTSGMFRPIPGGDGSDMLLVGANVAADFSSVALLAGRVGVDEVSLGATPPAGMGEVFSTTDASEFALLTQPSFDGSTVVVAGASVNQKSVLLGVLDKDGKRLIWNFPVAETTGSFAAAGAAHVDAHTIYVAWIEGTTKVKMQSVFCSPMG